MAQILTADMLLTAFITIALSAFFLHWRYGGSWCWNGYGAIGMSVLVKGPVGAAIPLLTGGIFLWWRGELGGSLQKFQAFAGLLLAAVIALPWFVAISLRQPDFPEFYLGANICVVSLIQVTAILSPSTSTLQ